MVKGKLISNLTTGEADGWLHWNRPLEYHWTVVNVLWMASARMSASSYDIQRWLSASESSGMNTLPKHCFKQCSFRVLRTNYFVRLVLHVFFCAGVIIQKYHSHRTRDVLIFRFVGKCVLFEIRSFSLTAGRLWHFYIVWMGV